MINHDFLTNTQVQEIISESRSRGAISHYSNSVESGFEIPYPIGQGSWTQVVVREGLKLGVLDVVKRQSHVHLLSSSSNPYLTSVFYLAGRSQMSMRSISEHVHQANYSYGLYLPQVEGIEVFPAAERVQIIQLSMDVNLFRELCLGQTHRLPPDFQAITHSTQNPFLFQFGTITPDIRATLQQILDCPYAGFIKRLYLESKALELLSLQLQQAVDQVESGCQLPTVSAADIERIHAAKAILSDRIDHPPGLMELSRLVGLNDFKLKQGFKQVYGTTVFGYLYEYRMQRAQQLLLERQMNIEEVARAVGYANRSSFAVAFRRKFGVNPKRFST